MYVSGRGGVLSLRTIQVGRLKLEMDYHLAVTPDRNCSVLSSDFRMQLLHNSFFSNTRVPPKKKLAWKCSQLAAIIGLRE